MYSKLDWAWKKMAGWGMGVREIHYLDENMGRGCGC